MKLTIKKDEDGEVDLTFKAETPEEEKHLAIAVKAGIAGGVLQPERILETLEALGYGEET